MLKFSFDEFSNGMRITYYNANEEFTFRYAQCSSLKVLAKWSVKSLAIKSPLSSDKGYFFVDNLKSCAIDSKVGIRFVNGLRSFWILYYRERAELTKILLTVHSSLLASRAACVGRSFVITNPGNERRFRGGCFACHKWFENQWHLSMRGAYCFAYWLQLFLLLDQMEFVFIVWPGLAVVIN